MTLLEVIAGLVVLGTLLVSVTIARGRFVRQWSEADRKLAAIAAADAQVAQWLAGPASAVPIDAEGTLDSPNNCVWQTRLVPDEAAAKLGTVIVRLQVIDRARSHVPLAQVDFLLPARPARSGSTEAQ